MTARDDRLRELQHRAFAPGGGLTDAESAELRELTRVTSEPDAPATDKISRHDPPIPPPTPDEAEGAERTGAAPSSARRQAAASIVRVAAALVMVLLLGFGAGWLVFGQQRGPALNTAERAQLIRIVESGRFDDGSVTFLGADGSNTAWHATQDDGAQQCIVLAVADQSANGCRPTGFDGDRFPLQAFLTYEDGNRRVSVRALEVEDASGRPVAVIDEHAVAAGAEEWKSQYSGDDLAIAERLDGLGYDGELLTLIGHDGDIPVWFAQVGDDACVLLADSEKLTGRQCAPVDDALGGVLELVTERSTYQVDLSDTLKPSLTVIRTPPSIVCDIDSGYCASVDDRSGEPIR